MSDEEMLWEKVGQCVTTLMDALGKGVNVFIHVPFRVEILELTWKSGIDVARNIVTGDKREIKTVTAPHWEKANASSFKEKYKREIQHYDDGSTHPGVYLFKGKGSDKLSVKVKVTNRDNLSGKFLLRGKFGSTVEPLIMEGPCPMQGEQDVELKITNLPDSLRRYTGDSEWEVVEASSGKLICTIGEKPRLEVFVVYDKPATFYKEGVWVEALRLMFKAAYMYGFKDADSISAHITVYCHARHGMRYDTEKGAPRFVTDGYGGVFQLMKYIKRVRKVVNCYDQAAAVQSFCGCLGVKVGWIFQDPFGYINTTNLVGVVGPCNNPFYADTDAAGHYLYTNKPAVDPRDKDRSAFARHAFVETASKYIRDACAGPHIGKEILKNYFEVAIDLDTTHLDNYFNPGKISKNSLLTEWENKTDRSGGIGIVV
jgi:hypothetical protein